jgi:hypothetical protein
VPVPINFGDNRASLDAMFHDRHRRPQQPVRHRTENGNRDRELYDSPQPGSNQYPSVSHDDTCIVERNRAFSFVCASPALLREYFRQLLLIRDPYIATGCSEKRATLDQVVISRHSASRVPSLTDRFTA